MPVIKHIDFVLFNAKRQVLDLRDEKSFGKGHYPGSINIPIENDSSIEPLDTYLNSLASDSVIHCFDSSGELYKILENHPSIHFLKDGYLGLKKWSDDQFFLPSKLCVLGGETGAMKTEILRKLGDNGEQIIDFEMLAKHKGSAFGNLKKTEQPTTETFYYSVLKSWLKMDLENVIWVEEEGPFIGRNTIPPTLYTEIIHAPMLDLGVSFDKRLAHIVEEYTDVDSEAFQQAIQNLEKRLGTSLTHKALHLYKTGQLKECVKILLEYYDKGYKNRRESYFKGSIIPILRDNYSSDELIQKLIELSRNYR